MSCEVRGYEDEEEDTDDGNYGEQVWVEAHKGAY